MIKIYQTESSQVTSNFNIPRITPDSIQLLIQKINEETYAFPFIVIFNSRCKQLFPDDLGPVDFVDLEGRANGGQYATILDMKLAKGLKPDECVCFRYRGKNPYQHMVALELELDQHEVLHEAQAAIFDRDDWCFGVGEIVLVFNAENSDVEYCSDELVRRFGVARTSKRIDLEENFHIWRNVFQRNEQRKLMVTCADKDIASKNGNASVVEGLSFDINTFLPILPESIPEDVLKFTSSKEQNLAPLLPELSAVEEKCLLEEKEMHSLYNAENSRELCETSECSNEVIVKGPLELDPEIRECGRSLEVGSQHEIVQKPGNYAVEFSYEPSKLPESFAIFFKNRIELCHSSVRRVMMAFREIYDSSTISVSAVLNVYKLTRSGFLTAMGVGIHHSGWCFNDLVEIGYGYADMDGTGVYTIRPKNFNPDNHIETLEFGELHIDKQYLLLKIIEGCQEFPARSYDLLRYNCNDFSDFIARAVGLGNIPEWINRAARIGEKFVRERQIGGFEVAKK